MNFDGYSFFSCCRDTVPTVVKGNDGMISWPTCVEMEEQSLTLVWAEEEEGAREQEEQLSAGGAQPRPGGAS